MLKLWRKPIKGNKFKEGYDHYWILKCKINWIDIKIKKIECKFENKAFIKNRN